MSGPDSSISTAELRRRLTTPTCNRRRPGALRLQRLALERAARGGHIPGAVAFPSAWLTSVDEAEIVRLLHSKGIVTSREVVLYGDGPEDVSAVRCKLADLGHTAVRSYERGFDEWAPTRACPSSVSRTTIGSSTPPGCGSCSTAAGPRPPRRIAGSSSRQFRSPGGVRRGSPPGSPVPRHEPGREPGRLESPLTGGARRGLARPRDHARHDGRPLRPRHRGGREREVARTPGRAVAARARR